MMAAQYLRNFVVSGPSRLRYGHVHTDKTSSGHDCTKIQSSVLT